MALKAPRLYSFDEMQRIMIPYAITEKTLPRKPLPDLIKPLNQRELPGEYWVSGEKFY
jgi:hypothetical protein